MHDEKHNNDGRELDEFELQALRRIAELKQMVSNELDRLVSHNALKAPRTATTDKQYREAMTDLDRSNDSLHEARRHLQTGFMWLNKAVDNPRGL